MGIHENTFVGPVIRCKQPTQTTNRQGRRCSNVDCKNHKVENISGVFCSTCGGKIQDFPIPTPMSIWDIFGEEGIDEDIFYVIHDDMHELGEGVTAITDNNCEAHGAKDGVLTSDDVTSSLNNFNTTFEKEIKILKKYYESVSVDYGIFTYYS